MCRQTRFTSLDFLNLGCKLADRASLVSLDAEAVASADSNDTEVRSLAFSQISKCCLLSFLYLPPCFYLKFGA